jgi:hypothetical protein
MYACSSLWPSDQFVCLRHPYPVGKLGSAIVIITRVCCFCFCVEEFAGFLSVLFSSHASYHIRLQHNAPTIPHCRYLRLFFGL